VDADFQIVVGGLGFIGCNLIERFSESTRLICVDDGSNSADTYFEACLRNRTNLHIYRGDINDDDLIVRIAEFTKARSVFIWHLAANSDIKRSADSPSIDFERTLRTSISVIKFAQILDTKGIAFASTSAVYGIQKNPSLPVCESAQKSPVSYYGSAKLASEMFFDIFSKFTGVPLYIFRFANIVGAPATHGLIFDMMQRLKLGKNELFVLGDGNQRKSYLHVKDLILDMIELVSLDKPGIYNLGPGDSGISVKEICDLILIHVAPHATISFQDTATGWPGDIPIILLSNSKRNTLVARNLPTSFDSIHGAIHAIAKQFQLRTKCASL